MIARPAFPLPDEEERAMRRAWRLEYLWLAGLASIVAAIYLTLGNSQAMKAAWIEDLLSFIPPLAFLTASWIERWAPTERFPTGFARVTSIAYLVSAVAIAGVGLFILYDSSMALIRTEHPTIGSAEVFGTTVWLGWLMIAALVYSVILPVIFGRLKLAPARRLHDKVLWADAVMNKADWMTGAAAALGVVGIGFGWWWADAVAALFISLDVLHDGVHHTLASVRDLIDEVPRTVDDREQDPMVEKAESALRDLPWAAGSRADLREEGRFLSGTVYVKAKDGMLDEARQAEAERKLQALNWRLVKVSVALDS